MKMKISVFSLCTAFFLGAAATASATTFFLDQQSDVVAPTGRGGANTTYFGWELFGNDGDGVPGGVVDDATPDIGAAAGVRIITTNGQDHTPFSGPTAAANIYTFTGTLGEDVTIVTDGVAGTGFTTIFVQGITAPQGNPTYFSGTPTFSSINGVSPTYVSGLNQNGIEQYVLKYELPGNQASYTFSMAGSDQHYSLERLVVDTYWSASGYQSDVAVAAAPEPGRVLLVGAGLFGMMLRRRRAA